MSFTLSGRGAKARRRSAPRLVQVTAQAQSASFSAASQGSLVQMSLACADTLHGKPRNRAA
jgi:hypothetical protein